MKTWMILCPVIAMLVFVCAATGWFVDGFYSDNADFMVVKFRTYDLVLLVFVIPLMLFLFYRARVGWTGAQLMLPGALIYLAFSYGLNVFNSFQNQLFVVYIAIFSLSTFGSVLGFADQARLNRKLASPGLLKAAALVLLFIVVSGLNFLLSDAAVAFAVGGVSPSIAGSGLPVNAAQVFDLGFILPLTTFGAIMAWRGKPIGLLISSAMLVFYMLITISVVAMEIGLSRNGFDYDPSKIYGFAAVFAMSAVMTLLLSRAFQRPA